MPSQARTASDEDPLDLYAEWLGARLRLMEMIRYQRDLPLDSRIAYETGLIREAKARLAAIENVLLKEGLLRE